MKRNEKPVLQVPLERVRSIAATAAPAEYTTVGKASKRLPRLPIYKQAILVLAEGEQLPVVIRNLNHTGCRIEYFKHVRPAGRVLLMEQSLSLEAWANVIWSADGASGLEFENCEHLLDKIPSSATKPITDGSGPAPRARNIRKIRSPLRKV